MTAFCARGQWQGFWVWKGLFFLSMINQLSLTSWVLFAYHYELHWTQTREKSNSLPCNVFLRHITGVIKLSQTHNLDLLFMQQASSLSCPGSRTWRPHTPLKDSEDDTARCLQLCFGFVFFPSSITKTYLGSKDDQMNADQWRWKYNAQQARVINHRRLK